MANNRSAEWNRKHTKTNRMKRKKASERKKNWNKSFVYILFRMLLLRNGNNAPLKMILTMNWKYFLCEFPHSIVFNSHGSRTHQSQAHITAHYRDWHMLRFRIGEYGGSNRENKQMNGEWLVIWYDYRNGPSLIDRRTSGIDIRCQTNLWHHQCITIRQQMNRRINHQRVLWRCVRYVGDYDDDDPGFIMRNSILSDSEQSGFRTRVQTNSDEFE